MERDSFLYKVRRQCQVIAHRFISNEAMSKFYFKIVLKKKLNLENPQTFNEKLQWLKLHDHNPLYTTMVDKYAVKRYVADKIGEKYIIIIYYLLFTSLLGKNR